jgi:peptide-methionine (S)-S-oxide reductase
VFLEMQDLIRSRPGVLFTRVGYTGGDTPNATYRSHGSHAEAIEITDVDTCGLWPGKVVTEITPAGPFWAAEPEHQDYLLRRPHGYTCHFPRPAWVLPRRSDVASRPSSQLT